MFILENWSWAECQLGNITKREQQFSLYGEKRKNEGKKEKIKKKRRVDSKEKRKE